MLPRRITALACFCLTLLLSSDALAAAAERPKPKLVVAIVVDQFRYDYLTRFRGEYHGGLDQMLTRGADFTNAFYAQVPTVTAVGHSIFLSGAMPAVSGVVANAWYDRDEGKQVTSVCDWNEKTIGGTQTEQKPRCTDSDPASPRRMLVSTLGDELRVVHPDSKVIGISIKGRGAVLPAGHLAQGAYWFDDLSGNFVSSSYYMDKLPDWAAEFNRKKLAAQYVKRPWAGFGTWDFHAIGSEAPYGRLPASPWGNELIEQFAEEAVKGEKLGQRDGTDVLTISFSSNDYVGHAVGPDAPEVRDMSIRTDQLLAKLFRVIDERVGLNDALFVLTADHGVAAVPGAEGGGRMPGGYVAVDVEDAVRTALNRRFGKCDWLIPDAGETSLYFDWDAIGKMKTADGREVSKENVYRTAKAALLSIPQLHVSRVYTRDQLDSGVSGDFIAQAETNGYYPRRSGDLNLVYEPGYMVGSRGTTHFSPYDYDRHVPILFMGPGVRAGRYDGEIRPNDIAPTLATMLDLQTPSGSSGRVLSEMLAEP